MWNGKVTEELVALAAEYRNQFNGQTFDMYEDYDLNIFSYEELVAIIKEAMRQNIEIPSLIDNLAGKQRK